MDVPWKKRENKMARALSCRTTGKRGLRCALQDRNGKFRTLPKTLSFVSVGDPVFGPVRVVAGVQGFFLDMDVERCKRSKRELQCTLKRGGKCG